MSAPTITRCVRAAVQLRWRRLTAFRIHQAGRPPLGRPGAPAPQLETGGFTSDGSMLWPAALAGGCRDLAQRSTGTVLRGRPVRVARWVESPPHPVGLGGSPRPARRRHGLAPRRRRSRCAAKPQAPITSASLGTARFPTPRRPAPERWSRSARSQTEGPSVRTVRAGNLGLQIAALGKCERARDGTDRRQSARSAL
jgi:hypothetical protein